MNLFSGLWVALVTPFSSGKIDEFALQSLIGELAVRGVNGFVPLGTTGESATLTAEERRRVISLCLDAAGGVPVVPGCGTNNTAETMERVNEAAKLGAQGAMVITPYYNKPTQEGLFAHFTAVADASPLSLLLYNVPGRTSVNMLPVTVEKLSHHKNIASIKEASGNLEQISEIILRVEDRMTVLSGDDALTLPVLSVGGVGIVSVAGHVAPEPLVEMLSAFGKGDMETAKHCHQQLLPVAQAMFLETNPAPVKFALSLQGKIKNELRLPLVPVRKETEQKITAAMKHYSEIRLVAHAG